MYWSRNWKTTKDCKKCEYHGIPKNAKTSCVNSGTCTARKSGREGQLYTKIIPTNQLYENNTDCNSRSKKIIIKSAIQPTHGPETYSYSYKELLRKRNQTTDRKLPTKKPTGSDNWTKGHGGECGNSNECNYNDTIWNPNNKQFHQQGAVDSSTRIDRLRLNTVTSNYYCPPNTVKNGKQAWHSCWNGNYLDTIRNTNEYNSGGADWRYNDRLNNFNLGKFPLYKTACHQEKTARRKVAGNVTNSFCLFPVSNQVTQVDAGITELK